MLYAAAFVVILIFAFALFMLALIWQPPELERAKVRAIKLMAVAAGVGLLIAAASLMLQGMETSSGSDQNDPSSAWGEKDETRGDDPDSDEPRAVKPEPDSPADGAELEERGLPQPASDEGVRVLEEKVLNARGPAKAGEVDGHAVEDHEEGSTGSESGAVEPAGTLSRESIQKGIQSLQPYVKGCYEDLLAEFPEAAGNVTIGFTIVGEDGRGRVELSELDEEKTTLFDNRLHECMLEGVGDVEFDVPEGGKVSVTYPFRFQTDEEGE